MKKKALNKLFKVYQDRHQYNIEHGIVPPETLIEEMLISDLADSFAREYGLDRDFLKEALYRCLNGTAPSCVYGNKILPYSKPCNRLHNWLFRDRKDPGRIFQNELLPGEYIRGILNGEEELTLEVLYYSIAVPYNLDKKAFRYLTYEVLEDYDDEKIGKFYSSIKTRKEDPCRTQQKGIQNPGGARTVFITGASGFIARSLLKTLKNYRLILLYHKVPKPQDLALVPDGSILYIGDVRNEFLIKRIFLENQIDIVYWMAGMTTHSQCANAVGTYFHNCHPLHVVYQLMNEKAVQIKGIILPSTCLLEPFDHYSLKEIAGVMNEGGASERYAASKLLMELEAVYFSADPGFPVVITRLSQVYGNDPDSDRLIPVSVKKAKQGKDLVCVVDRTGRSQQIAPIHVTDVANALSLLGEKILSDDYDFRSGRCLTIMGPQILTVEEILMKIVDFSRKKVGITKLVKEDVTFRSLNSLPDEARRTIGFVPGITIDEGLKEIIKPLHGAHVYYCDRGKKFDTFELLVLIAGARFFRLKNPHSTLDFYGDKATVKNLSDINKKLHLYDNMNDTIVLEKAQELKISQERFFNFPKFAALEALACRYKGAVCLLDTDLIPAMNLSKNIYDRGMCCTHYESLEKSDIYPGYDELHPPKGYCFLPERLSYSGEACNTSILGIREHRIALEYVWEAYDFMSNNTSAVKADLIYVEQVLFPLIAFRHDISVYAFIDQCFRPATGDFALKKEDGSCKRGWDYCNINVILDDEFPVYHTWIAKKRLAENDLYRRFAVMRLTEYIRKYFPQCHKAMMELPEMREVRKLFEKNPIYRP